MYILHKRKRKLSRLQKAQSGVRYQSEMVPIIWTDDFFVHKPLLTTNSKHYKSRPVVLTHSFDLTIINDYLRQISSVVLPYIQYISL